jgi:hypothetical protein
VGIEAALAAGLATNVAMAAALAATVAANRAMAVVVLRRENISASFS